LFSKLEFVTFESHDKNFIVASQLLIRLSQMGKKKKKLSKKTSVSSNSTIPSREILMHTQHQIKII